MDNREQTGVRKWLVEFENVVSGILFKFAASKWDLGECISDHLQDPHNSLG